MEKDNRVVIADHIICLTKIVYAKKHTPKSKTPVDGDGKVTPIKSVKEKTLVVLDNETEIVLDCTLQEFLDAIPDKIKPSEELTDDDKGTVQHD